MQRCRDCSYTPKAEPKVFCPACGAMWHEVAPSRGSRGVSDVTLTKPKTRPKPKATVKKAVSKKATKNTTGKEKRNPTKKKR